MSLWLRITALSSSNASDTKVFDQVTESYDTFPDNNGNRILRDGYPTDSPKDRLSSNVDPEDLKEVEKEGDINVIKN